MLASMQPTKKYFLIMFLISCVLLEIFTFVVYQQSRVSRDSDNWVIHSYEVMRLGRLVMLDAVDLANDERDYMLTGDASYLKTYNFTSADLVKRLDELRRSAADNTEQEQNILALAGKVQNLKRLSDNQINFLRRNLINAYTLKTYKTETQRAIADVRTVYDAFIAKEGRLLEERRKKAWAEQKKYFWTLIMGGVLGLGALVIANLVIFSLIAKNTRAEKELRKSESLFSIILNGLNDGVYDYDVPNGTIEYSPSYQKMLGYTGTELSTIHDDFYSIMHPDDVEAAAEIMRQYLAREIPAYINIFRIRHKKGRWVWIMSRGIGIWDENGQIRRLIGTHTDISIQKQHEEELAFFAKENELQRAELALAKEKAEAANRAKGDFLATMSHEIRTPMNAVIGLASLLLETKLDDKQKEMTETLHANADILLQLVDNLLDFSRIESGQIELEMRPFIFDGVFKGLHAMFDAQASTKSLVLSITNNIGKQSFFGDPTRIQQILMNLIGNALKFTHRGSISVVADAKWQDDTVARIRVVVTDTGVGIPPEKINTIFDKFVQADQTISRRFGGSGLGLAICKVLAELMGGTISVVSHVDEGSIFTLSLPMKIAKQQKQVKAAAAPPLMANPSAWAKTVLVVEDYEANVMVATLMLENLGYRVDVACSGAEAIQKVRIRPAPYAAILMDVQMQDLDGYETTRRIRTIEQERGMRHFIIGVTAHALAGDREKCIDAGMDDYMSKPVHPDLLAQKLNKWATAA
jgi:PAS domain S-box-containing protein